VNRGATGAARGLLVAALLLSAVVPLGLLLVWSVSGPWFYPALLPGAVTGESWRELAGGGLAAAALRSVALGAGTALLAVAAGSRRGGRSPRSAGGAGGRPRRSPSCPVAAPPLALAVGVQLFFLRAGLGGTMAGVLLAHLVPAAGYVTLYFLGVFAAYDPGPEEEARTLGATARQAFWRVTVPALRRQVAEAAALGFLVSWAQVAFTQLVGGGLVRTLPTEVFAYVRSGQDRYAATGALLLSVPPLLALAAARLAARRSAVLAP
jgi:putative spermidine/putrescine transport system permease protein